MSDSVRPPRWQPTRLPRPWDSPGKNTGVGCHFLLQCMKVKSESEVAQLCLTLSDPMDCSLPGSSIHGIFQARVLEWGAIVLPYVKYKDNGNLLCDSGNSNCGSVSTYRGEIRRKMGTWFWRERTCILMADSCWCLAEINKILLSNYPSIKKKKLLKICKRKKINKYAHLVSHFSRVRLFATLWTVAHQAPLSLGFSRQEYWSG